MKKTVVWFAAAGLVLGLAAAAGGGPRRVHADGQWTAQDVAPAPLVPPVWEHTGRILDESGAPVTGVQTLEVRLYGAQEGGDVLWGRQAPAMLDGNGTFSVRLSDALGGLEGAPGSALEDVLAAAPVWIECTLAGHSSAMAPRAAVAANPYALFADEATAARGDFDVAGSLKVAGTTQVYQNLTAGSATSSGNVDVANQLSAGGDVSLAGGLKAGSLSGIGAVPVGTIIFWYGDTNSIPAGWALCDGTDGRPDMRGRFPVGASTNSNYSPGNTGGEESVTLSLEQMAVHTHTYELRDDSNRYQAEGGGLLDHEDNIWNGDKTNTTTSVGGGDDGNTQPHENRPPFKAIHFIMRVL